MNVQEREFAATSTVQHVLHRDHDTRGVLQLKTLQLGINYGMGVPSLARGLNRHPLIASGIIEQHRRTHPRFWQWRDDMVLTAMLRRRRNWG